MIAMSRWGGASYERLEQMTVRYYVKYSQALSDMVKKENEAVKLQQSKMRSPTRRSPRYKR